VNTLSKTLFVGCDVSSKNNTVCLMDEEERRWDLLPSPTLSPEQKPLRAQLLQILKEKDFSTLKIATEATSFLDLHLVDFLASSQDLAPFNPSSISSTQSSSETSKEPTPIRRRPTRSMPL
jgi:transposase